MSTSASREREPAHAGRWAGVSPGVARGLSIAVAVVALVALGNGLVAALGDVEEQGAPLWDLDYYRAAATRWFATGDPYLVDGESGGYFYSPIVTPLIARIFLDFEAERLYTGLVLVTFALALLLSIRAVGPPAAVAWLCWLYAVAFGNGEGVQLLVSGNLAWIVGLGEAGALLAAARGRWPLFYLLVGLGCLIKPYSLALLVLPFVLDRLSRWALVSVVPLAADTLGGLLFWPELAAHRLAAIRLQVIEPLQLRYTVAGRLSRLLADLGLDAVPATVVAVTVQLAIAGALALYLRRHRPAAEGPAFALAALAALAAVPRQVGYDAYAFAPAVFMALWALLAGGRSRAVRVTAVIGLAAGLFKEGLVILPLVVFAAFVLARASGPGEGLGGGAAGRSGHRRWKT